MPFITGAASWHANSDEVPISDYTTEFKQPAQQEIYEPGPYRASDHDPVLLGLSLAAGDEGEEPADPTDPDPEEPTDPEEPEEPTEAKLTIGPERIAVQDVTANGNSGKDVGVLLQVDGLEAGQDVTFTVTRQTRNGDPVEHTVTTNDDGAAEWRVTHGDVAQRGAPMGTYDVEATYDDNDEVQSGSFEVSPNTKSSDNRNSNANSNSNNNR